jgi:hypothetical protein
MTGIQLPNFLNQPTANITDPADPDRNEVNQFRTNIQTWSAPVLNQMTVFHPHHGLNLALPPALTINADQAAWSTALLQGFQYCNTLFPAYVAAYGHFTAALAGALIGQAPPCPCAVKAQSPDDYDRKSPALGQQFLCHCENYAAIMPFDDDEIMIRWALQMLVGPAICWRDEQITLFNQNPMPAHLGTWAGFKQVFSTRFANPYKADKATDAILQGKLYRKPRLMSTIPSSMRC